MSLSVPTTPQLKKMNSTRVGVLMGAALLFALGMLGASLQVGGPTTGGPGYTASPYRSPVAAPPHVKEGDDPAAVTRAADGDSTAPSSSQRHPSTMFDVPLWVFEGPSLRTFAAVTTRPVPFSASHGKVTVRLDTANGTGMPVESPGTHRALLRPWRGHAEELGCTWPAEGVTLLLNSTGKGTPGSRPVTAIAVSVAANAAPGRTCVVEFVAAVSAVLPPGFCVRPKEPIGFLRFPPLTERSASPSEICIAVDVGGASTRPFFMDSTWQALTSDSTSVAATSAVMTAVAPMRCDQGLYMGFTNIIQALITCVVHAMIAGRADVIFPGRFQHKSFDELFDGAAIRAGVLRKYGVRLTLLPRSVEVTTPDYLHLPHSPKVNKLHAYRKQSLARPGVIMFTGDNWMGRINTLTEKQQLAWFNEGIYRPSPTISEFADRLTMEMQTIANQSSRGEWVALHLRLENDVFTHKMKASAGAGTLATMLTHMEEHKARHLPAYYASGELPADVQAGLPKNWRCKADYYPNGPWTQLFEGTWFKGKKYMITNATGSLVDMFLLLRAPLAIVSEISSFGEFVAAMRCPRRTIVYNKVGTFYKVPCNGLFMFNRGTRELQRAARCDEGHQSPKCNELAGAAHSFAKNAEGVDRVVEQQARENLASHR